MVKALPPQTMVALEYDLKLGDYCSVILDKIMRITSIHVVNITAGQPYDVRRKSSQQLREVGQRKCVEICNLHLVLRRDGGGDIIKA